MSGQVQSLFGLIGEGTELWQDFSKCDVPIVVKSSSTTQSNTGLMKKKKNKTPKEKSYLHQRDRGPTNGFYNFPLQK